MNRVIEELDQFIAEFLTLTKDIPHGTGLGAETLRMMDDLLKAGKWRGNPNAAQARWQAAAAKFQSSSEFRGWRVLHDSLGKTAQRLLTAFPEIRST